MAEGSQIVLSDTIPWCRNFIEQFRPVKSLHQVNFFDLPLVPRWTHPPDGALKINVDDRCLMDQGVSGIAAVIRDSRGHFIAAHGQRCMGVGDPLILEADTFRLGIIWALRLKLSFVQIESDSLTLCTYLTNDCPILSPVGHIISEIRTILATNPHISVYHVLRQGNMIAHAFADLVSVSNLDHMYWWGNPPPSIVGKICTDNFIAMKYSDYFIPNPFQTGRGLG